MNALDTNILVRYFVEDLSDSEAIKQRTIAKEIMRHKSYVPLTVILEMVWVLFSHYQLPKQTIVKILQFLLEMTNIEVENATDVKKTSELFLQGMDFADALHLLQVKSCEQMYTFDKKFVKKSRQLELSPTVIDANSFKE